MLPPRQMLLGALLIVAGALQVSAADPALPVMTITGDQVRNVTESVTLNCTVSERGEFSMFWMRYDREGGGAMPLAVQNELTYKEPRYSLNSTSDGKSYLLTITDIRPDDSAIYECKLVMSGTKSITQRVDLMVRTPAQVDLSAAIADHQQPTREGAAATLACRANGHPRPSISWQRDGGALMPGGGDSFAGPTLQLDGVKAQDRGTYWCVAHNGIGTPDRRSMRFEVAFVPRVRTPRPRVAQALGHPVELQCVVEAHPAPVIEWFRRAATATSSGEPQLQLLAAGSGSGSAEEQGYEIRTEAGTDEVTVSVLRVGSVAAKHFGQYACRATNGEGVQTEAMELYRNDVPTLTMPNGQVAELPVFKSAASAQLQLLWTIVIVALASLLSI